MSTMSAANVDVAVLVADMVVIPGRMYDDMLAHAKRVAPNECVGVLAAQQEQIARVSLGSGAIIELVGLAEYNNHSPEPASNFFVEPHAQYEVEASFMRRAWETVAVYHSHPTTDPVPSASDMVQVDGRLMIIIGLTDPDSPDVRCWRAVAGEPEEVRVEVSDA